MVDPVPVSKTRRKQEMHALQDLGETLVTLTAGQLAGLELPERLADAIEEAKRISGFEARRRQMQFIGRLMRDADIEPITQRVAALRTSQQRENARHHDIEIWRDRLLEDDSALTELARTCPGCDLQQIRTLARHARKEQAQGRAPHATRALFRALRTAFEQSRTPD